MNTRMPPAILKELVSTSNAEWSIHEPKNAKVSTTLAAVAIAVRKARFRAAGDMVEVNSAKIGRLPTALTIENNTSQSCRIRFTTSMRSSMSTAAAFRSAVRPITLAGKRSPKTSCATRDSSATPPENAASGPPLHVARRRSRPTRSSGRSGLQPPQPIRPLRRISSSCGSRFAGGSSPRHASRSSHFSGRPGHDSSSSTGRR